MTKANNVMAAGAPGNSQTASLWARPRREWLAALCACAGELVVAVLANRAGVSPGTLVAIHCAVAAWTWLILFAGRKADEDTTLAALMLLLVAVAGPAGAAAALLTLPLAGKAGAGPEVLQAWYTRLAQAGGVGPATAMHDRVAAGRVLRLEAPPPARFLDVIASGTLEERQTALGLMARRFHPDFAPALEAALRSPEPVVRVQAAAVVARVRGDLKIKIRDLLCRNLQTVPARRRLAIAGTLQSLAGCSLVEDSDKARCRAAAGNLLADVLISTDAVTAAAATPHDDIALAMEGFLIDSGRLKDLRIARRVRAIAARGSYRVRRVRPAKAVA